MLVNILMDNTVLRPGFKGEAGLSMLVESSSCNILFDTGASPLFYSNSRRMDIELFGVDHIVLSHGHYDHSGGLRKAVVECSQAKLWLHRKALEKKYSSSTGVLRYIGLTPSEIKTVHLLDAEDRVEPVKECADIDNETILFSTGGRKIIPPGWNFFRDNKEGQEVPDHFKDEISMLKLGRHEAALFVGCAHCGLKDIFAYAETLTDKPITVVFGGSHLNKASDDEVAATGEFFLQRPETRLYLGHCTGISGFSRLYRICGDQLCPIAAGTKFEIHI